MSKLSPEDIYNNINALSEAVRHLVDNPNGMSVSAKLRVKYREVGKKGINLFCEVTFLYGTNEQKVHIMELDRFDAHIDFSTNYQRFEFDGDKEVLSIKGDSCRTGKAYTIELSE